MTTTAPRRFVIDLSADDAPLPPRLMNGCPVACLLYLAAKIVDDPFHSPKPKSVGHALELAANQLGSDGKTLEVAYAFVPEARKIREQRTGMMRDALMEPCRWADRLGNGDLSLRYRLR